MTRASRVQQEIKQRKPFRSKEQEAVVALFRTTDLVRRLSARSVEAERITLQQYNVLRILRGAGPEGLPTLEIAERMIERAPGVTRLLDRIEAKKLVHRHRCPTDRRQVTCTITESGLELLARIDELVDGTDRALMGGLTEDELEQLIGLLDRVRDGLRPTG
jgi:MarR family transcriptional regulator, organic hydroperoxide resistance regulator